MAKTRIKDIQTAQGMVEFALVLPVLLLVILGIFAFGHLFFTYSTVVSASREAARWGAAVGDSPASQPRYQDCTSIRAAAVRVGKFAGVNATDITADPKDTGVSISFDHGPNPQEIYDECPEGDTGPDEVVMGDRINVVVRVMYTPIVPLVNLPSFPLEATTSRTILRSVPVGEAPTAEDPCFSLVSASVTQSLEETIVGQEVKYTVQMNADNGTTPVGSVLLTDDALPSSHSCEGNLVNGKFSCNVSYELPGEYHISVHFTPGNSCYPEYTIPIDEQIIHKVSKVNTLTIVSVQPFNPGVDEAFSVKVAVQSMVAGFTPTGNAVVTIPGFLDCQVTLDSSGEGWCPAPYSSSVSGPLPVTATYPESPDPIFNTSSDTITVDILPPGVTPTAGPTPTRGIIINTPTPGPTPTNGAPVKTPLPSWCPSWTGKMNFTDQLDGFAFGLKNNASSLASIRSIQFTWPTTPAARLQEVRFGNPSTNACNKSAGTCLFNDKGNGIDPPSTILSSSVSGWNTAVAAMAPGASKEMRLTFGHNLPNGHYSMVIAFNNNCILEIADDRLIVSP